MMAQKTWQTIRTIIGKNTNIIVNFPSSINIEGEEITNSKDIANVFYKFFFTVGHNQPKNIPNSSFSAEHYFRNTTRKDVFLYSY